ncbi:MAG: lipid A deacylase LpxR family protein [Alphaproteobacteria bacterium]
MSRTFCFCVLAAAMLLVGSTNYAAAKDGKEDTLLRPYADYEGTLSFSLENDIFSGEDDNYTNGVRISYLSAENNIPNWLEETANTLPFFSERGHKRWHVALGQSMFTPSDITQRQLQPNDRPYAGWLYSSVGVISDTGYRLDNLQLEVGVLGPASGADITQDFVHDLIDSNDPQGWDNQLDNEPGIILTYERKWRGLYEFSPFGMGVDITPSVGGSVGNIYTHAAVGTVVRVGYDLPSDYGPPLIRPNLPGSDFFIPNREFGWYLFAGLEGRAVARNIFLDGNTFSSSHSVDKRPFVGGVQAGIAFIIYDTRISYTHLIRTQEFQGQREKDEFGSLAVSFRF